MRKKGTHKQETYTKQQHLRSTMWASLEVTTFLIVYLVSIVHAREGILPFILGWGALMCVMACEAVLKKRLWIFEPLYKDAIGHPETPIRLATFMAGILLVLEITYLVGISAK